ncbi:MAG: VWA domain-containing protein [Anaerolineales bacterium]|nr:VWA domain-containing protein [Anaerolineales bacterium]
MAKLSRIRRVVAFCLVFGLLITPSTGVAKNGPAVDYAGGIENRIEVVLEADQAPSPGGTASLRISATPLIQAPDLQIQWIVPPEVELVGTDTEFFGSIAAHKMVSSQREIRFSSEGIFKVAVRASFQPANDVEFGASGVLFFTIKPGGSEVSDMDPQARSPMGSIMPTQVDIDTQQIMSPDSTSDDPCFAINGRLRRIDREPTTNGYSADTWVPVSHAVVDVREEDLVFDDSYAEVITNENGEFSYSFCDDDGWFDDTLEIYIRLVAEIYAADTFVAEVIDSSWIDEVYEYDSWVTSSDGGTLTFNSDLTVEQSAVFNIADAIYEAWDFWRDSGGENGGDALFDEEGEVHWEPGYGDTGSYYISFWGEITIADDPSDSDEWDDSVIIHEWGHMADDLYSCDDNPGGQHFVNSLVSDPELSWGEGYPDYYQSAVRAANGHSNSNRYLDIDGSNSANINVNLETWDITQPTLVNVLNEFAIAAALWDFSDNVNDGQDQVNHGHDMIQRVYTSETFESIAYGFWDDTCEFDTFARAWVAAGNPANAATAAAILQNTGYTFPPAPTVTASQMTSVNSTVDTSATMDNAPSQYVWWNTVTQLVDNSASMAGTKINAVKTVLDESINDLGSLPEGTEFSLYTFNNSNTINQTVFAGQFFPENLKSAVSGLTTSSSTDGSCQVQALRALAQAVDEQSGGDVWLFTDGDTYQNYPSVETMKQILNDRQIRASVALLGLCPSTSVAAAEMSESAQVQLEGAAQAYLGLAAEDTPGGLVPYLLTAINSGGQFLYVDSSQIDAAADILRAQITHSAGAGRWSDYVSDVATYRWDELTLGEYNWIDATVDGALLGHVGNESYLDVDLPQSFSYYNSGPYTEAHAYENGYITLGNYFYNQGNNTQVPNGAFPNNALYPFWDQLAGTIIGLLSPDAPDAPGLIYTKQMGDWFAIEYVNFYAQTVSASPLIFEVLLNISTGEIRYQYNSVADGAGSATIGLENSSGTDGVQVSYNDVDGATSGMGYQFTPVPPQPSKTYTVTVDTLMAGVGFLLTGYSGSFEPLEVSYPDGSQVSCSDEANVLCLDLGLVQYIQVDVDNRAGEWNAVVDAGKTGAGTFSFISMAASELSVNSPGDRSLTTIGGTELLVDLGKAVDGNILTGWFRQPDDKPFGTNFTFFDDGKHGDGFAGDGRFGADPFTPSEPGTGYLFVEGKLGGINFVRADPIPFTFQPINISSRGDGANSGGGTDLMFDIKNLDTEDHCYWLDYEAPNGWHIDGLGIIPAVCVNAGETHTATITVYMAAGSTNDLPSGTGGIVILTVTEWGEGIMSDSASARVTRHRSPDTINIFNPTFYLRPAGDTTTMEFMVLDDQHVAVADGTQVQLNTTLGSMSPGTGITHGGFFTATFTTGSGKGTAIITASTTGNVSATTEVEIGSAEPSHIILEASARLVPPDGVSTSDLVATVKDRWDTPVADQVVRIGVAGDGQMGTISGSEVITGTTNAQGQFTTTFTSGTIAGHARVRAELLVMDTDGYRVVHDAQQIIEMIVPEVYLPLILR